MRKLTSVGMTAMVVSVLTLAAASSRAGMQVAYEPGSEETVKYTYTDLYRNWVEMGRTAQPSQVSLRRITQEVTMNRRVLEATADGEALVEVTIQSAALTLDKLLQNEDSTLKYVSDIAEGTRSDWPGAPALAGAKYVIRVAPDTTVLEIRGIEEVRAQLGVSDGNTDLVASFLTEDFIKQCHERAFVRSGLEPGGEVQAVAAVPNVMIKAQAIQQNFMALPPEDDMVAILITGAALHVAPDDMAAPPEPRDWGRSLIKEKSDMDEFAITGIGQFDLKKGSVRSEVCAISALLVLLEENVFPNATDPDREPSGNVMFTKVEETHNFQRMP